MAYPAPNFTELTATLENFVFICRMLLISKKAASRTMFHSSP